MTQWGRRLGVSAVIILLVAGLSWALWSLLQEDAAPVGSVQEPVPTQFSQIEVVGWHKGNRQWRLLVSTMAEQDDIVDLTDIRDGVIFRDGKDYMHFTADHGKWHRQSNDLRIRGHVVVTYKGQRAFETDELIWEADARRLRTPTPVRMALDGNTLTANGLLAYPDEDRVELTGGVRVELGQGRVSKFEAAVYDLKNAVLHATGRGSFAIDVREGDKSSP